MKAETKQIIVFILLSYLFSWAMWGVQLIRGEFDNVTGVLIILGPGIAALIVSRKTIGIKRFIKQCYTFEQRFLYYGIILAFFTWRYITTMLVSQRIEGSGFVVMLAWIPFYIIFGGNEEFGWRYLQTQMEKKMHCVYAAFICTLIWTFWHIPNFLAPWDYRNTIFDFLFFLGFCLTSTFSLAAIYKLTRSVLFCVLFHAFGNALSHQYALTDGTGPLAIAAGYSIEGLVSMTILILIGKGLIKPAKEHI